MEQQLIDALRRLPIAIRIITQIDLEGTTWYYWQVAEAHGTSQDFVKAVEQALASVFTFIATDAGYNAHGFKQISSSTYN